MPRIITLNSTNNVPSQYKNVYDYQFPSSQYFSKKDSIAIAGCNLYYATYNISAALGNNQIIFRWPTLLGINYTIYTITIPDGMYSAQTLNEYLQYYFIQTGFYLINTNGDYVYYCELLTASNYYGFQFNFYPVPASLPAGWTQPGNWQGYSAATLTPQLRFQLSIQNTSIGVNLGYQSNFTFPPNGTAVVTSVLSTTTPQITDQVSFIVRCSLVRNMMNPFVTDILYTFSPNGEFGSLLSLDVNKFVFNKIAEGYYDRVRIEFVDQFYQPLRLIDENLLITLMIHKFEDDGENIVN